MFLLIRGKCKSHSPVSYFTFHNVSINTLKLLADTVESQTLHSTMFLLIHIAGIRRTVRGHSFTFHNVSINTTAEAEEKDDNAPLHSTMFLLIH